MIGDRKEMDGMRQDDRGITLVEIIIAIAACVIVISAASLFIRNALQGYGLASDAIDLQIEAQVLMEQFSTWVMEGNYVYQDSVNDAFIIYHIPRKAPSEELASYMGERWIRVFWCDGSGKLYMYKAEDEEFQDPTAAGSNLNPAFRADEENRHLLSSYVDEFEVDIETDSSHLPNKVTVTLLMKAGIQRYEFRDEINIRNASYVPVAESPQPSAGP